MARTAARTATSSTSSTPALPIPAVAVEPVGGLPAAAQPRLAGVVLVGTPSGLRQMAALLGSMERAPGVVGYVVVGPSAAARAFAHASGMLGEGELGEIKELPLLAARFGLRHALVCVPASMGAVRESVFESVRRAGLPFREVAAMEDVLGGSAAAVAPERPAPPSAYVGAAPVIDLAALIGRTPHGMDRAAVAGAITGKRVMITGAGGSIGSELAKVAAGLEPELLILMERGENALFEIDRLIGQRFPRVPRRAVLHDVVDAEATMRLCEGLRPHAVFHAAAHKHVPLMEDHPAHAVTNNLFGTKAIADAAVAFGAERFVMISSDKAVNPTSVMGATKRLAELYVHGVGGNEQSAKGQRANQNRTRLSMVRFGNVLGSAASVLTIWSQQIAEGGPVTITDPRMTRYFMTIPEAATLVVQSTVLGSGDGGVGVYVLDMGRPVRIVDLALRFVRAHGLSPRVRWETAGGLGEDVRAELERAAGEGAAAGPSMDVVFTGIRPGEKLHEELAYAAEQLRPTAHPGVRSWAGPGFEASRAADVARMVRDLHAARHARDRAKVIEAIRAHVPEMRPSPAPGPPADHPAAG